MKLVMKEEDGDGADASDDPTRLGHVPARLTSHATFYATYSVRAGES
jgi:hypothetical protein